MLDPVLDTLRAHERFLLTTHCRPDGDAIGSQLALGRFLEKAGKHVTMLNTDPPPYNLEWLPGAQRVEVFDGTLEQRTRLAQAEVAVVLDTNAEDRLGDDLGPLVRTGVAKSLLIDHHTGPETWFDVAYQRDTAAATGELVYEIIRAWDPALIDADIATVLYTAIMTDTGSFRYSSVTPATHRIVADLLERGGIQAAPIHRALYDNRSFASVRLLGHALDGIRLRYDGQIAYTIVTSDMLRRVGADTEDKKGIINYLLSIRGVRVALLFSEISTGTKISFRSEGDVHVNGWARAFDGGGHRNASGAFVKRSLEETIEAVLKAAPQFIELAPPEGDGTLTEEDASYLSTMLDLKAQQ